MAYKQSPRRCFVLGFILALELMIVITWTTREMLISTPEKRSLQTQLKGTLPNNAKPAKKKKLSNTNMFPKQYRLPQPDCTKKLLIYECTSATRLCSGLGDREKGLVSSFLLALLTNRTFVIKHTRPCALSNFFEPNLYDWTKCSSSSGSFDDRYYVEKIDGMDNLPDLSTLEKGDIWTQRTVVIITNQNLVTQIRRHPSAIDNIPWLYMGQWQIYVNLAFNALFKLTKSHEDAVNDYIRKVTFGGKTALIGLHIRREFIEERNIPEIFDALTGYTNISLYTIYVATEDLELRKRALEHFPNSVSLNVTGVVSLHVQRKESDCDTLRYAIYEQQLLARSKILFRTRSGFSQLAEAISRNISRSYEFKEMAGGRLKLSPFVPKYLDEKNPILI